MHLIIRDSLLCSCRAPTLNADGAEFSWAAPIAQLEEGCGYLFKKSSVSQTICCCDCPQKWKCLQSCAPDAAWCGAWYLQHTGPGEAQVGSAGRQEWKHDENIPDKSCAGIESWGLHFSTLEAFRFDAPECWPQLAMARWAVCAQPNTERLKWSLTAGPQYLHHTMYYWGKTICISPEI